MDWTTANIEMFHGFEDLFAFRKSYTHKMQKIVKVSKKGFFLSGIEKEDDKGWM